MEINEYTPIIDGIIQEAMIDMAIQNEEFRQWLIEEGYITLHEDSQQQWYIKWKGATISGMKATVDKYLTYSNKQINKNRAFLEKYKEMILNSKKYPVQGSTVIQNAPLYDQALQRISRPLSNGLIGINLEKVEISGEQENQVSMGESQEQQQQNTTGTVQNSNIDTQNLWLKKMLIPGYNGRVSFTEGAKAHFYGSDSRVNMNVKTIQQLLPKAYEFCYNYSRTAHSVQTDLNGIVSFVNKDPMTGQQQTTAATQQQAQQADQQNNGMASTNPTANTAVNASVEAEYFFNRYGLQEVDQTTVSNIDKPISPARSVNTSQQAHQTQTAYTQPRANTTTTGNNQQQNSDDNTAKKQEKTKEKETKNQAQLLAKKKQAIVELVRDAFNAKLTAMGLIYRDFIKIMNNHVLSYKQK